MPRATPSASRGRPVSTRLELPVPPDEAPRSAWALRATDVDLHGHVNNAVHWQAVEDALRGSTVDTGAPLVAELDYHHPIDLSDRLEVSTDASDGGLAVGFHVGETVCAVARVGSLSRTRNQPLRVR